MAFKTHCLKAIKFYAFVYKISPQKVNLFSLRVEFITYSFQVIALSAEY